MADALLKAAEEVYRPLSRGLHLLANDPVVERLGAALSAARKDDGWISGHPPKDDGTYLVANDTGQVAPLIRGVIHNNIGSHHDWNFGEAITAYRLLPAAPAGKEPAK